MSESMIERVARAIAPKSWAALGTGDTLAHENRRKASLNHARAAILEIAKKPSDFMVGHENYVAGLWSRRNYQAIGEAMIEEVKASAPSPSPTPPPP